MYNSRYGKEHREEKATKLWSTIIWAMVVILCAIVISI